MFSINSILRQFFKNQKFRGKDCHCFSFLFPSAKTPVIIIIVIVARDDMVEPWTTFSGDAQHELIGKVVRPSVRPSIAHRTEASWPPCLGPSFRSSTEAWRREGKAMDDGSPWLRIHDWLTTAARCWRCGVMTIPLHFIHFWWLRKL